MKMNDKEKELVEREEKDDKTWNEQFGEQDDKWRKSYLDSLFPDGVVNLHRRILPTTEWNKIGNFWGIKDGRDD